MTTSVANIRDCPIGWADDDRFVYIGRANPRRRLPASKWANPFVIGRDGDRDAVIAKYRDHIESTGLIHDVSELRNKVLVCWCSPLACHGDILAELATSS